MDIYYDYENATNIVTNEEAISNSIRNILMTMKGSLPGKPDFGSHIHRTLFNLMDGTSNSEVLKTYIIQALLEWEPRINITSVEIDEQHAYNRVVAKINYTYVMLGKNLSAETNILLKD